VVTLLGAFTAAASIAYSQWTVGFPSKTFCYLTACFYRRISVACFSGLFPKSRYQLPAVLPLRFFCCHSLSSTVNNFRVRFLLLQSPPFSSYLCLFHLASCSSTGVRVFTHAMARVPRPSLFPPPVSRDDPSPFEGDAIRLLCSPPASPMDVVLPPRNLVLPFPLIDVGLRLLAPLGPGYLSIFSPFHRRTTWHVPCCASSSLPKDIVFW